jgi:DNA-binding response OmpR family regulator
LRFGGLRLNRRQRLVLAEGRPLPMRRREFELLEHFMRHPGRCFTRDELLAEVWGLHFDTGTNVVDVQVYALRQKLRPAGLDRAIQTVRGVGYRLGRSP